MESKRGDYSISIKLRRLSDNFVQWITAVYGPVDRTEKDNFWKELKDLEPEDSTPWVIGGDFNAIRFANERNSRWSDTRDMEQFNNLINELGLIKLPLAGKSFTWSNMRDNPALAKLDRILMSPAWESKFPNASGEILKRVTSDHNPIGLSTGERVRVPQHIFRFEKMWLDDVDLEPLVQQSWSRPTNGRDAADVVTIKLRRLRKSLIRWNKSKFGDINDQKLRVSEIISDLEKREEVAPLPQELMAQLITARNKAIEIANMEETMWRQKSRVQWLKEGDANTAFFHRYANLRRKLNWISSLNINGSDTTDEEKIENAFFNHFRNLFTRQGIGRATLTDNLWSPDRELCLLERPFTQEELKTAIWQLGPDKAPGPDGFPILFYKRFWELVKDDLSNLMTEVERGTARLDRLNLSFVVLIPKKEKPTQPGDYRPICLLNGTMKIITKILANRLKVVLGKLVGDYQAGFVGGRFILDNVATAEEVIHSCRKRKEPGYLLKLDFEKAYDTVNWDCVTEVLNCRGFGQKWIN